MNREFRLIFSFIFVTAEARLTTLKCIIRMKYELI